MLKVINDYVVDTDTGEVLTITPRQLNCIRMIEDNLDIEFEGTTISDAREFISNNMEASKKARSSKTEMRERVNNIGLIDNSSLRGMAELNSYFNSVFDKHFGYNDDAFDDDAHPFNLDFF